MTGTSDATQADWAVAVKVLRREAKHFDTDGSAASLTRVADALAGMGKPASKPETARPLDEWDERIGDVMWWKFPIQEAPWVGTPQCLGYTVECHTQDSQNPRIAASFMIGGWPGYHTHWTPLPASPEADDAK